MSKELELSATLPTSGKKYFEKVNCAACGLYRTCGTPLMEGHGPMTSSVLFVGEAPGEHEDDQGRPFVGPAGETLRYALIGAGLDPDELRFTNTVRCRPPNNELKKYPSAVKHCKGAVLQEIEDVNPKLVVLLGNQALAAVLGKSGITEQRGKVVEKNGRLYLPMFHPAYVRRDPSQNDLFAKDILTVDSIVRGTWKPHVIPEISVIDASNVEDIWDALEVLGSSGVMAIVWDLETSGLDPWEPAARILSIALTPIFEDGTIGRPVSIPIDHKDTHIDFVLDIHLREAIKKLLENPNTLKIGHNLKFDIGWIQKHMGIEVVGPIVDTMLMHYTVDEQKGTHGLKSLAGVFTKYGGYEEPFEAIKTELRAKMRNDPETFKGTIWENMPLLPLLDYNAKDTFVTAKLYQALKPRVAEQKQWNILRHILFPAVRSIGEMEQTGIRVDVARAFELDKEFSTTLVEMDKKMRRHDTVRRTERILRSQIIVQDRVLHRLLDMLEATGVRLNEPSLTDPKERKTLQHKLRGLLIRKNKKIATIQEKSTFKFKSVPHMRLLLFRVMELRPLMRTSTGDSANAATLKAYSHKGGIIPTLLQYRKIHKQLGTYIKPITEGSVVKSDGKIHANYLLHGTETGRLSCGAGGSGQGTDRLLDKYNMQNLPKKGPIRGLFVSDFQDEEGRLVSADFNQGEFVLMGVIAKEQAIIDAANKGIDLHKNSAALTYKVAYKDVTDEQRTIVKSGVSFGLIYGRSSDALGKQFGWGKRKARKFVEKFFEAFPRILIYHLEAETQASRFGYVESPFGLRRRLPQIRSDDSKARGHAKRAAINFPVQNALAYCTIIAINRLSVILKELGLRAKLVATVHDSIVIDAPGNEIEQVTTMMTDVMENLGLSWMRAALKITINVSKTLEK